MKKPKLPVTALQADVDAIMKLVDHCKRQGISFFEGPAGLKFGFRRESIKPQLSDNMPKETGDEFIP